MINHVYKRIFENFVLESHNQKQIKTMKSKEKMEENVRAKCTMCKTTTFLTIYTSFLYAFLFHK